MYNTKYFGQIERSIVRSVKVEIVCVCFFLSLFLVRLFCTIRHRFTIEEYSTRLLASKNDVSK